MGFRVLVAGGRGFTDYHTLRAALDALLANRLPGVELRTAGGPGVPMPAAGYAAGKRAISGRLAGSDTIETWSNSWKLRGIGDASFSACVVGTRSDTSSTATRNSAKIGWYRPWAAFRLMGSRCDPWGRQTRTHRSARRSRFGEFVRTLTVGPPIGVRR
jgi:hypothetical protein